MHGFRCVSLVLGTLVLQACASSPSDGRDRAQPPPRWLEGGTGVALQLTGEGSVAETTLEVGPGDAWRVLPEVYDALGLGGSVTDAVGWSFGNPEVTSRTLAGSRTDSFFRCANEGAGPSAVNRFRIRFSITTTVGETEEGTTRLTTDVAATGRPWEGTSSGAVICTSKGTLEAAIERGVLERTGAGG